MKNNLLAIVLSTFNLRQPLLHVYGYPFHITLYINKLLLVYKTVMNVYK